MIEGKKLRLLNLNFEPNFRLEYEGDRVILSVGNSQIAVSTSSLCQGLDHLSEGVMFTLTNSEHLCEVNQPTIERVMADIKSIGYSR